MYVPMIVHVVMVLVRAGMVNLLITVQVIVERVETVYVIAGMVNHLILVHKTVEHVEMVYVILVKIIIHALQNVHVAMVNVKAGMVNLL